MKIEAIAIKDLVSDPSNARKHKEKNIEAIKGSLLKFGQQKPIVVNDKNIVIAGNGTLEAAKALGWDKLNVVRSGLDKLHQTAFAIADNRSSELAEWDIDVLGKSLDALEDDFDLEGLGFDEEDIAKLTPQIAAPGLIDDDEVPETDKNEFGVVAGDIWQLGNHRVMCGDSTNIQHVELLMNGKKADMVFTDPPYGMNLDTNYLTKVGKNGNSKSICGTKNYKKVIGDSETFDPAIIFSVFADCPHIFLWGADYYAELIPNRKDGALLVWDKRFKNENTDFHGSHFEICWSKHHCTRELIRITWMGIQGMSKEDNRKRIHPTQKPIVLVEWFFERFKGDLVIDLFLGSGSTLIACEKTNRTCYGMEIDPHYCSVIIKRWQDFTGKTAVRVTDEKQSIKPTKSKKLGTNAKEAF